MAEAVEAPVDGRRLKALRERAGWTQAQAARAAGLSRSALATAEQGRSRLGAAAVGRLLAVYGAAAEGGGVQDARPPAAAGRSIAKGRPPRPGAAPPRHPAARDGGCPHDRAVVDAMTAEGMACRCLACGAAFVEAWGR